MQTIISQYKRIDSSWQVIMVADAIESMARSQREYTVQEVVDRIVNELCAEGEDAYTLDVDRSQIKQFMLKPSDQIEIRVFDYDIDDEVALVRVGADAKNNIHIAHAPSLQTKKLSLNVIR